MINKVNIKDFAIIDDINIDFNPGLTVITGETGSGKSIILEAISSLINGKFSKSSIKHGASRSVVELEFDERSYRKIYNKTGRSKSYIDEVPMTQNDFLKSFESKVEFHGQNDQQIILKTDNQIDFLDYFCGNQKDLAKIKIIFDNLEKCRKDLIDLHQNIALHKEKKELLEFQLNEIQMADIKEDEEEKLYSDYKKLNNQEDLIKKLNNVKQSLNDYENGVVSSLTNLSAELNQAMKYDNSILNLSEIINSMIMQLQEIEVDIEARLSADDFDISRLPNIEERISLLEQLKRKYGGSIESIFENEKQIRYELNKISNYAKSDSELKKQITELEKKYTEIAFKLSENRKSNADTLSSMIEKSLAVLNMNHAKFDVRLSHNETDTSFIKNNGIPVKPNSKGIDQVEFYLSANPGEPLKPMSKVASGGEMSRIMLAIKTVFQDKNPVSTLIFDEIDTGISGETAQKVSRHLKKLSKYKQVICITHLPQIAISADYHLHVTKSVINSNSTSVKAEYLNGDFSRSVIKNLFVGEEVET